jgi:hypothetical protein
MKSRLIVERRGNILCHTRKEGGRKSTAPAPMVCPLKRKAEAQQKAFCMYPYPFVCGREIGRVVFRYANRRAVCRCTFQKRLCRSEVDVMSCRVVCRRVYFALVECSFGPSDIAAPRSSLADQTRRSGRAMAAYRCEVGTCLAAAAAP